MPYFFVNAALPDKLPQFSIKQAPILSPPPPHLPTPLAFQKFNQTLNYVLNIVFFLIWKFRFEIECTIGIGNHAMASTIRD
jgi:hypothetical protein